MPYRSTLKVSPQNYAYLWGNTLLITQRIAALTSAAFSSRHVAHRLPLLDLQVAHYCNLTTSTIGLLQTDKDEGETMMRRHPNPMCDTLQR